jgi:hypothetical protein
LLCGLQQGFGRGQSGSLPARQLGDEAPNAGGMQRDRDAVGSDIDPFDQQPEEPRLLSGLELVPNWPESAQRFDEIGLVE